MQVIKVFHDQVVNAEMDVIPDLMTPLLKGPIGFQK